MSEINPFKPDFHFDYRSIISAPGKALSLKKVFVGGLSLAAGLLAIDIFTLVACGLDGQPTWSVMRECRYFPLGAMQFESDVATLLRTFGFIVAVFFLFLGLIAIAIINIEELRGNRLCSARDGIRFAMQRCKQSLYSFTGLCALVFTGVVALGLLGILGRIPAIGDTLLAALYVIPGFLIAMLVVFLALSTLVSLALMPSAIAADRVGESFTSLLETLTTIIRQPSRWISYTVISLVTAKVCLWCMALMSVLSLRALTAITSFTGGQEISAIMARALSILPTESPAAQFTFTLVPSFENWSTISLAPLQVINTTADLSAIPTVVMAIALTAVFFYIAGFAVSILATSQTYAFVIIKYVRDDYSIPAEEPLLMTPEWINPPIQESIKEYSDTPDQSPATCPTSSDSAAPSGIAMSDDEI